jgi:hypothetical protein
MQDQLTTEDNAWRDAYYIAWVGASNPQAVRRALDGHRSRLGGDHHLVTRTLVLAAVTAIAGQQWVHQRRRPHPSGEGVGNGCSSRCSHRSLAERGVRPLQAVADVIEWL